MIKIINTKSLGGDRFEILFSRDGAEEKQIVRCRFHQTQGHDLPMPFIVPEDSTFFEIWESDPKLRRELKDSLAAEFQKA